MRGAHANIGLLSKSAERHNSALFPESSANLRHLLKSHTHDFRAGTVLKDEGDESSATCFVLSGWVALSKILPHGERQIIDVTLQGEIVHPTSADGHLSTVQIETLTDATVATVPDALWSNLAKSDPELRRIEMASSAATLSRMSERMLRLGRGSAESRIAYALIEFCVRLTALGHGKDGTFHLPMTQQILGDFVGLSSVHVCRTVRRLSRSGIISATDHMDIVIHDVHSLAEIAGLDLEQLRHEIIAAQ